MGKKKITLSVTISFSYRAHHKSSECVSSKNDDLMLYSPSEDPVMNQ